MISAFCVRPHVDRQWAQTAERTPNAEFMESLLTITLNVLFQNFSPLSNVIPNA